MELRDWRGVNTHKKALGASAKSKLQERMKIKWVGRVQKMMDQRVASLKQYRLANKYDIMVLNMFLAGGLGVSGLITFVVPKRVGPFLPKAIRFYVDA